MSAHGGLKFENQFLSAVPAMTLSLSQLMFAFSK